MKSTRFALLFAGMLVALPGMAAAELLEMKQNIFGMD